MSLETKSETLALVLVALTSLLAMTSFAQDGGLDVLLEPISRLDISGAYLRHHVAADLIIFFTLNLALIQTALRYQFKGRAAPAASVALSAALTIGLVLAEQRFGFSIQDFGPIAAALLVLILAVVIYRLVHYLGLGAVGSGALAIVIAYLGVRATLPGFFTYAAGNPWLAWIHVGVIVAVIVFAVRGMASFVHSKDKILGAAADTLERPVGIIRGGMISEDEAQRLERERQQVSSFLQRIVDRPWKETAEILQDLAIIKKAIERFGTSREGRRIIAEKIRVISAREHVVLERIRTLEQTNQRLKAFDLRLLNKLRAGYDKLSDEERKKIKDLFARQVQKLELEDKISSFERNFLQYDAEFRDTLEHLVASLRLGQIAQARQWIDRALAQESKAEEIMEEIQKLEEQIKALTNIPLSELRTEEQLELFK